MPVGKFGKGTGVGKTIIFINLIVKVDSSKNHQWMLNLGGKFWFAY